MHKSIVRDFEQEWAYDFEQDIWVSHRLIQARWIDRELPEPDTAPTQGKWHGKPGKALDHHHVTNAMACLAVLGGWLFAYSFYNGLLGPLYFSLGILFGIVPLTFYAVSRPSRLRATARDRRLIEDPWDLDTCLVEVAIYRPQALVGIDRGVAWFDSGRLLFNGSLTSFAIGGEDVQPRRFWARSPDFSGVLALPLRMSGGASLEFRPLRGTRMPTDHEERFIDRLNAFRMRPPESRGPRQWPPFEAAA